MSFEAYRIGVTLALTDKVSAGLGLISKAITTLNKETKETQKALTTLERAMAQLRATTAKGMPTGAFNNATQGASNLASQITRVSNNLGKVTERANAATRAMAGLNAQGARGGNAGGRTVVAPGGFRMGGIYESAIVGGMMGAGYGKAFHAASEFETSQARFGLLNLGPEKEADARQFALNSNIPGVSAREMTDVLRDLHAVLGNYEEAKTIAPKAAALSAANAILFEGGKMDRAAVYALEKASELRPGGKNSPAEFLHNMDVAQHLFSGSGGAVTPQDYYTFMRRGGTAALALSDTGILAMEPAMQALGSANAGTALMSAYQNLSGRGTTKSIEALIKYGLVDKSKVVYDSIGHVKKMDSSALVDAQLARENLPEWISKTLIPHLPKEISSDKLALASVLNDFFSNRKASQLATLIAFNTQGFEHNLAVNQNSLGMEATTAKAQATPAGNMLALHAQWENALTALGETTLPAAISGVSALTKVLKSLTDEANDPHVQNQIGAFAALFADLGNEKRNLLHPIDAWKAVIRDVKDIWGGEGTYGNENGRKSIFGDREPSRFLPGNMGQYNGPVPIDNNVKLTMDGRVVTEMIARSMGRTQQNGAVRFDPAVTIPLRAGGGGLQ